MNGFRTESMIGTWIDGPILEISLPETWTKGLGVDTAYRDIAKFNECISQDPTAGVLVNVVNLNIDTEARQIYMNKVVHNSAAAFLVDSIGKRMVVNFLLLVKTTPVPVKIFEDRAKAIKWLKKKIVEAKSGEEKNEFQGLKSS